MSTVQVSFVDATTGAVFAEADLPVEQLPETFEISTTLHLGDDEWSVVRAEPATRAEYAATSQLRLTLHRIERMDPNKILYSLPTIETALPPGEPGDTDGAFRLGEDDWRQVELVASRLAPEIEAELAEIRAVHAERTGSGFQNLHVRERIVSPVAGARLTVAELARVLGGPPRRSLVVHADPDLVVTGGFAFAVDDTIVYGREDGSEIVELGVAGGDLPAALAALASQHALLIVDWCRASVEPPRDGN